MKLFISLRALSIGLFLAFVLAVSAPPASAGDPQIDAAKDAGIVGERLDGYLGLVTGNADGAIRRKINEVNARRRALYEQLSRETGTTVEQVGIVTGEKQIAKTTSGQFYMGQSGQWIQK